MRRSLSVGTRWALVYTFVTTIALSVPIGFIYLSVARQIERDAWLLADSYVAEVRAELEDHPETPDVAVRKFTERLRRITPELDYGAAYFAADGTPRFRIGSLAATRPLRLVPAEASRAPAHRLRKLRGREPAYLVATIPVPGGFLAAAVSNRSFATSVGQIRRVVFVSAPIVLALSGLLGAWFARRSLRPIAQMTASARRIGGENLSERIPTRGTDDELDRLAATLNEMFDRIGDAMQRLHGFSADAAHQLKSPIASLQNEIEVTLAGEDLDESTRRLLGGFLDQVVELGSSVGAMLRLARSESGLSEGQAAPVELRRLLDGVVSLFHPVAEERGVSLELKAPEPVEIQGDLAWLREMFASLVQNAVAHTLDGGSVTLSLAAKPGEAVVEVADSGEGIPEAEQERIFDRFYRVSPARGVPGSGLGLALARQIAMAHGGTIEVQSRVGFGSIFTVRLSRSSRPQPGAPRPMPGIFEGLRA
jgi:two-component system heavy metal sensor histidine kinase CusS